MDQHGRDVRFVPEADDEAPRIAANIKLPALLRR
jgi:hypothetical protein